MSNSPQTSLENHNTEYVIDKLVGHKTTIKGTSYQVRWYGYKPAVGTLERETNITNHFIPKGLTFQDGTEAREPQTTSISNYKLRERGRNKKFELQKRFKMKHTTKTTFIVEKNKRTDQGD